MVPDRPSLVVLLCCPQLSKVASNLEYQESRLAKTVEDLGKREAVVATNEEALRKANAELKEAEGQLRALEAAVAEVQATAEGAWGGGGGCKNAGVVVDGIGGDDDDGMGRGACMIHGDLGPALGGCWGGEGRRMWVEMRMRVILCAPQRPRLRRTTRPSAWRT